MQRLNFGFRDSQRVSVLALGAHSDDIEIGCGGTILRLREEYPDLSVYWVVLTSGRVREAEARASAEDFLAGVKEKQVVVLHHRDGFLPYRGEEVKDFFEDLKTKVSPDVIFTHYRQDLHQDHRLVCDLTWNTFRNHLILEYEIPKYDGDLGQPNFFVQLDERYTRQKGELLMKHFGSQTSKYWFTVDTINALLRIRGVEGRSESGLAEGFYLRKGVY